MEASTTTFFKTLIGATALDNLISGFCWDGLCLLTSVWAIDANDAVLLGTVCLAISLPHAGSASTIHENDGCLGIPEWSPGCRSVMGS